MSNILRVIYVKFMIFGGGGLILLIIIGIQFPELNEWLEAYSRK